ncbi:Uma2 family endonuclease [Brevibacillus dissolubilis]|uniref:Uma2 family endonuclease n=1 Tax=Brevibacillus dissolubilis TaxID=1844116 RepID=UPI001115BA53|nr:Uma2 family endonuclease [Brevibacillus dissolubilis]
MSIPHHRPNQRYTYQDYLSWTGDTRWELFEGVPHSMTPSPSTVHQQISMSLSSAFYQYLKGKTCSVFAAPFDVRLVQEGESEANSTTVVQPDITIICDPNKLDAKGCLGSPDLLVEILSPSTAKVDLITKRQLYEKFGVPVYWIIDPVNQFVQVLERQKNGLYGTPTVYFAQDDLPVTIFDGFMIPLRDIFTT